MNKVYLTLDDELSTDNHVSARTDATLAMFATTASGGRSREETMTTDDDDASSSSSSDVAADDASGDDQSSVRADDSLALASKAFDNKDDGRDGDSTMVSRDLATTTRTRSDARHRPSSPSLTRRRRRRRRISTLECRMALVRVCSCWRATLKTRTRAFERRRRWCD